MIRKILSNLSSIAFKKQLIKRDLEDNLKDVTKNLIRLINKKDKYKNSPKNEDMDFDEFIDFSENMEFLAKHLNFKFVDYTDRLPKSLEIISPKSQELIENNIYLLIDSSDEEGIHKKSYLLIHDIRKLSIVDLVKDRTLKYDEIALASKKTMSILLGSQDTIKTPLNASKGADDYMNEVIVIAKSKKATEIYISLRSYNLSIRLRNNEGSKPIATKGIVEAQIIRRWLEIKSNAKEGAKRFDGMFLVGQDEYRINFQSTYRGYRATIRVYQNEFKGVASLSEAGYSKEAETLIKEISLSQDGGMLFVAQTGQGKTTTANILLENLALIGNEVIAIGNPIEKFIPITDQIDMTHYANAEGKHKLTKSDFIADAMRSKADVIDIGELRNKEDMESAFEVAVTGHFFIGTIHAFNIPTTVEKLIRVGGWSEMDIKSLIRGLVIQQLTRALCPECKIYDKDEEGYKANHKGCPNCKYGYRKLLTPIAEVAKFPTFKDFDLKKPETYESFIGFIEDAENKFKEGIIDSYHLNILKRRERIPAFWTFIPYKYLDADDRLTYKTFNSEEDFEDEDVFAEIEKELNIDNTEKEAGN